MLISYIRTVILYLLLILVVRVMGKRQIGQMEPTEFVVTIWPPYRCRTMAFPWPPASSPC